MTAAQTIGLPNRSASQLEMEVARGLSGRPKTLSPWLFYDSVGSRLFEDITELPEYYLTRTERSILVTHAEEMIQEAAGTSRLEILELGAGSAAKTSLLLKAALRRQEELLYVPIDVSATALQSAKMRLESEFGRVRVEPKVADYSENLECIDVHRGRDHTARRLVLSIGSSIGNFDPGESEDLLRRLRARLSSGDGLLLGLDMVKDRARLVAAYNDVSGTTARFNKNVLLRINRELGGSFDLDCFRHEALWNPMQSRVEMHLRSVCEQSISISMLGVEVSFAKDETIHTENSYKFTPETAAKLIGNAGFTIRRHWMDPEKWFGVFLATAY